MDIAVNNNLRLDTAVNNNLQTDTAVNSNLQVDIVVVLDFVNEVASLFLGQLGCVELLVGLAQQLTFEVGRHPHLHSNTHTDPLNHERISLLLHPSTCSK